jgi:transcriptional regulator with GAF, ATPase, and Fis domain
MFSQRVMRQEEFDRLAVFANQAAIAIKNAQLFAEVEALKNRPQAENVYLQRRSSSNTTSRTSSGVVQPSLLPLVEQVAATDATVLILGETGPARSWWAVHDVSAGSGRWSKSTAALPSTLIESELFGHERGAFTGRRRKNRALRTSARWTIF